MSGLMLSKNRSLSCECANLNTVFDNKYKLNIVGNILICYIKDINCNYQPNQNVPAAGDFAAYNECLPPTS